MKNYIFFLFFLSFGTFSAQVAIGKTEIDGSAILDFAENTNKGLILPWVEGLSSVVHSAGTIIYNVAEKKIKWYDGANWNELSVNTGNVNLSEVQGWNEKTSGSGVIIGETEGAPIGILVLNKAKKALVLPKNISPWENIIQPEAGTMVYDTTHNLLCVFNGTEWTFWGE